MLHCDKHKGSKYEDNLSKIRHDFPTRNREKLNYDDILYGLVTLFSVSKYLILHHHFKNGKHKRN